MEKLSYVELIEETSKPFWYSLRMLYALGTEVLPGNPTIPF